jgi:hypothetical protein
MMSACINRRLNVGHRLRVHAICPQICCNCFRLARGAVPDQHTSQRRARGHVRGGKVRRERAGAHDQQNLGVLAGKQRCAECGIAGRLARRHRSPIGHQERRPGRSVEHGDQPLHV